MKKHLFLLFISLTIPGSSIFASVPVISGNHTKHHYISDKNIGHHLFMIKGDDIPDINLNAGTEPHLRVQLYKDAINTDDTYIGFEPGIKTTYVFNQDAPYMQGSGEISMASISSDNVKLAINRVPLPAQSETIRLYVNAVQDGTYKLNMTEDEGIPQLYEVWLMDAYKKDSVDMRQNPAYTFSLLKADTNSFGSNRFSLVIRQNPALAFHLLDFTAEKISGGVQTAWKTENEQGYTNFTVERSTDGGQNYANIDSLISDSLGAYSFLDKTPAPVAAGATDQYRLKIQDFSGTVSYSSVVTLMYSNTTIAHTSLNVYPNPASGVINFSVVSSDALSANSAAAQNTQTGSYDIKIINLSGIVIKTASVNTQNWQTDVSNLMPGTYIVQMVKNGDGSIVGKSTFVKL